ncbi:DEAD/DEAH box helicase family protein [Microbacterium gorillae]|uniref:hypothetical protein n=1 Tax=Microbacterium gorillae TaxID=1231063 RepID=UPI00058F9E00|nr:hypothetical protein [Microbacterium gorillae]
MRIVVSGTHASGKSTLISDFALRHPEYAVLADPFEDIDESWDSPGVTSFVAQLNGAAHRLISDPPSGPFIAERCPLDFLAYLLAWGELRGRAPARETLLRAMDLTGRALQTVDVLVVLPLVPADAISAPADEEPALRVSMNDVLLDLLDDPDLVGDDLRVLELSGSPATRLASLERSLSAWAG